MAKTFTSGKKRSSRRDRNDPLGATADAIAARRVLRDCHFAMQELRVAAEGREWRLRWVAVITLLRVVGHVLGKVDSERSSYLADAIQSHWARVKAAPSGHVIFHDFIERERNTILKEYDTSERIVASIDGGQQFGLLIGAHIIEPLDAVRQAIGWWERLLTEIEEDAQRMRLDAKKDERRVRRAKRQKSGDSAPV